MKNGAVPVMRAECEAGCEMNPNLPHLRSFFGVRIATCPI